MHACIQACSFCTQSLCVYVQVSTCNSVLSGLVNSLLPLFVRQLASDYEKWSNDVQYRAVRAARSMPLSSSEY